MKKLNVLVVFLIGLTILSCSSDDNNGANDQVSDDQSPEETTKLLKKISISGNGNYSLSFFYNADDKLDRIESSGTSDDFIKQFYYENETLNKAEYQDLDGNADGSIEQYVYNDGQLIKREDYFNNTTLDETYEYSFSNELINSIKYFGFNETSFSEEYIFEYDTNDNVISKKIDYSEESISDKELTFSYDDKKSPFLNLEPNIVLIDDFYSFVNNPTSQTLTD